MSEFKEIDQLDEDFKTIELFNKSRIPVIYGLIQVIRLKKLAPEFEKHLIDFVKTHQLHNDLADYMEEPVDTIVNANLADIYIKESTDIYKSILYVKKYILEHFDYRIQQDHYRYRYSICDHLIENHEAQKYNDKFIKKHCINFIHMYEGYSDEYDRITVVKDRDHGTVLFELYRNNVHVKFEDYHVINFNRINKIAGLNIYKNKAIEFKI